MTFSTRFRAGFILPLFEGKEGGGVNIFDLYFGKPN